MIAMMLNLFMFSLFKKTSYTNLQIFESSETEEKDD